MCQGGDPPDLLLLDLHLPGTDGPQILRAVRDESRLATVPVVVVSGASADWLRGIDLSRSSSLIHKSMDVDDYLRRIAETVLALHPRI
jgi:CheY-like chemotaxis protein